MAVHVECNDTSLRVSLVDGRELTVTLAWFPRLLTATAEEKARWQLIGGGEGIHWPDIDEDISVASLLGLPTD
jgi:hypothetical protein